MGKIITNPITNTKIKRAVITGGTIIVEPDRTFRDFEISLDTLKTLFGKQIVVSRDSFNGRECFRIDKANFAIVNSESLGADIELEIKVNDILPC